MAHVRKWVSVGRDDRVVWGECQGSGTKPYQVQFDLVEATSKCSCPSRKFPCKHALGLMLVLTSAADAIALQAATTWVEEWIAGRAAGARTASLISCGVSLMAAAIQRQDIGAWAAANGIARPRAEDARLS